MKKAIIPILVLIIVFTFAGHVQARMANPATVYCGELGYQVETITEEDGGQYSICVFPDGNVCDAWKFMQGVCGEEYSYCAINGYSQITKNDGKNPFSGTYSVCVDGSIEIGNPLDLMGITKRLSKPSSIEDELPPISPSPEDAQPVLGGLDRLEGAFPSSFDWRTYQGFDWMTPVKDQSQCGSCWAFGAIGTVEAVYNLHQNQPNLDINLSEEYVNTDCNGNGRSGCCGGKHENALTAIRDNGVPDDACLVYDVATYNTQVCSCDAGDDEDECRGTCPNDAPCSLSHCADACFDVGHRLVKIEGYHSVGNDVDDIKAALVAYGPLTTALQFSFSAQDADGIYDCGGCGLGCGTNHCVIITGWDDDVAGNGRGAWIIKNSWGNTDDGDGYRLVAYNDCNIQDRVVWIEPKADTFFPSVSIPNDITFSDTCVGGTNVQTLNICNTGKADLSIFEISSNDAQFQVTEPLMDCHDMDGDGVVEPPDECSGGFSTKISPDFCYPFEVTFTPTSTLTQTAVLTVRSSDIGKPSVSVAAVGIGTEPEIQTSIANSGNFGNVCIGDFKDIDLTINNSGDCDLVVTGISSSNAQFQVPSGFLAVIGPGASQAVPVRLAPTSLGEKNADIGITSNDPNKPTTTVAVSGITFPGDIRVTGSGDFGDVCADEQSEKTISVHNVGPCNLSVSDASINCLDFEIINNPFPAVISPDSHVDMVVRFTPQSAGIKSCTLSITSDDPDTSTAPLLLTGNTPFALIDVPPDQGFPPTVIQSVDTCSSYEPFPVSNTGICNLSITDLSVSTNPDEFSLMGLPSFPIILESGNIAGAGDLSILFAPNTLARSRTGTVSVTYIHDPVTGTTRTETRALCGEGVRTGARVLVTNVGVPMSMVKSIKLQRIGANKNKNRLDTLDNAKDLLLQTVATTSPCDSITYHREYGTVSNPIQLAAGAYQITVTARINNKNKSKTVGFDVSSCDFNPTIIVDF